MIDLWRSLGIHRIVRALTAVSLGIVLVSCAGSPSDPENTTSPLERASVSPKSDLKDLQCPRDSAAEGTIGDGPMAEGEITPEAALDAYFASHDVPLSPNDFALVAEAEGLVQLASKHDEKIVVIATVMEVGDGGWVVGEFASCRGFLE